MPSGKRRRTRARSPASKSPASSTSQPPRPSPDINLPFITIANGVPKHLTMMISRSKFEELVDSLIERCRKPVLQAMKDAKLEPKDIDEVVLVGGSTRVPKVQRLVKEIFN